MLLLFRNTSGVTPVAPFVPSGSFLGFGIEPSYNSLVSPEVYIPASGFSFADTQEARFVNKLRRNLTSDTYTLGNLGFEGSIDTAMVPSGSGGFFMSLLGCDQPEPQGQPTGASIYVFEPSYTYGPSLSLVTNTDTSGETGVVLRRSGAVVSGLSLSASFGEIVNCDWSITGATSILGEISDFTPSWFEVEPLHFTDTSISINDVEVDDITSFSISIQNDFTPRQLARRDPTPQLMVRSGFSIELSLEISLENSSYWTHLKNGEEVKVSLDMDNSSESLVVSLPRTVVQSSNIPVSAGEASNKQSLSIKGIGGSSSPVFVSLEAIRF